MRWFGPNWGAPVNTDCDEAPLPIGSPCMRCGHSIQLGDSGLLIPHAAEIPAPDRWGELTDEQIAELARNPCPERPWHLKCFSTAIGLDVDAFADTLDDALAGLDALKASARRHGFKA